MQKKRHYTYCISGSEDHPEAQLLHQVLGRKSLDLHV
jgi:hypothetical protein